jgi:hypothetical protein
MPEYIRLDNNPEPNPFRKAAIFVVHGIGEQALSETAATLRVGFEDTLSLVQPDYAPDSRNNWIVPAPYVYEARWSNYGDVDTLAAELSVMNDGEREYFRRVWENRAVSATASVSWLAKNATRLIWKSRGLARLYYFYLMPLLVFVAASMLLRRSTRRLLADYVNDARIYLSPVGDIEHMIVQRIDRKVGERFLKLLGYDWNFNRLPLDEQLTIAGVWHKFPKIVWVGHSLGTVISYNVISDILHRCVRLRDDIAEGKEDAKKEKAIREVEDSLVAFVTLGSPLDKIAFLFGDDPSPDKESRLRKNTVLRHWPTEYLPENDVTKKQVSEDTSGIEEPQLPRKERDLWKCNGEKRAFWYNFHYTSDPVSGPLDKFTIGENDLVTNIHVKSKQKCINTHKRQWWGISHVGYWKDVPILAHILWLTFDSPFVKHLPLETQSPSVQRVALLTSAALWFVVGTVAALSVIGYLGLATWKVIEPLWELLKSIIAWV